MKTESGHRFTKGFIDSFDTPFLLFEKGIIRFDKGEFNSYYIMGMNDKAQIGLVKFNKDLSFNSFYVVSKPGLEDRLDAEGNLICQYFIEGNTYTKSTDGSKYLIGDPIGFIQGNKEYYYVR